MPIDLNVEASITIFPAFFEGMEAPGGKVSNMVEALAHRLHQAARDQIGDRRYSGHHPERGRRLMDAGRVVHAQGPDWSVVFSLPADGVDIAYIHHEGARSHYMPAKTNEDHPRVYVRTSPSGDEFGPTRGPIDHPGAGANRYLVNAARQIGLTVVSPAQLRRSPTISVRAPRRSLT